MSKQLERIEVKHGNSIDRIRFIYQDDTDWSTGRDAGHLDPRIARMTDGEYLVKVQHETFHNYSSVGAAIEFTTNLGRVFAYHAEEIATHRASEQTVLEAAPHMAITALKIHHGKLVGIEETCPPSIELEKRHGWHIILSYHQEKKPELQHFYGDDSTRAKHAWAQITQRGPQKPHTALFLDAHHLTEIDYYTTHNDLSAARDWAISHGYLLPKGESEVTVTTVLCMLGRLLATRADISLFLVTLAFLLASSYFEVLTSIMSGHLLSIFTTPNYQRFQSSNALTLWMCAECTPDDTACFQKAIIGCFLLSKLLAALFDAANVYLHHQAGERRNLELRKTVFNHVLSLDQPYIDTHSVSEIDSGMQVNSLNDLISWNFPYVVAKAARLLFTVYYMSRIDPWMTAFALTALVSVRYFVVDRLYRYEKCHGRLRTKHDMRINRIHYETLDMLHNLKLFSSEHRHRDEYQAVTKHALATVHYGVVLRCLREFIYHILEAGIFSVVVYASLRDFSHRVADIGGFFLLFGDLQGTFGNLDWQYKYLRGCFPDIKRLLALLEEQPTVVSGTATPTETQLEGDLELRHVHFTYPSRPGQPVLSDLDLTIRAQETTAIVGESGSGKSTLAKLLMRLYDPCRGEVRLGGQALPHFCLSALHRHITIVPQNPDLFNCSIGENIAYGLEDEVSQEDIECAARLANADGFITELGNGYDTYVGKRGFQLSGGQKQRVAIARAALRQPKILILDEATSSLDAENEHLVQEALERLMRGRTTIVIAHRLSTIRGADRILCLEKGQLLEEGTHESLMKKRGGYYRLVRYQESFQESY